MRLDLKIKMGSSSRRRQRRRRRRRRRRCRRRRRRQITRRRRRRRRGLNIKMGSSYSLAGPLQSPQLIPGDCQQNADDSEPDEGPASHWPQLSRLFAVASQMRAPRRCRRGEPDEGPASHWPPLSPLFLQSPQLIPGDGLQNADSCEPGEGPASAAGELGRRWQRRDAAPG